MIRSARGTFPALPRALFAWAAGTLIGALAGAFLPLVSQPMGIMLYGMFFAIILPPARRERGVLVAVQWGCVCLPLPLPAGTEPCRQWVCRDYPRRCGGIGGGVAVPVPPEPEREDADAPKEMPA